MQTVLIIAKPYEAALLRKAVEDSGLQGRVLESEDALGQALAAEDVDLVLLSDRLAEAEPQQVLGQIGAAGGQRPIPVMLVGDGAGEHPLAAQVEWVVQRPLQPAVIQQRVAALSQASRGAAEAARQVDRWHALVQEADYFSLLELAPDATGEAVEQAYQRLRRQFADELPPDVATERIEQLAEILQVLQEARRVLGDERLRTAYRRARFEEEA